MAQNLKVLAVIDSDVVPQNLSEVFSRDSIALYHARSGAAALILTGNSLYDLLVITEPVSDLPTASILSTLQSFEWASAGTPALVMADDDDVDRLTESLESYPARVLSKSAQKQEIQQAVAELLGVPVRSTSRMMVNVEVKADTSSSLRCFQSANISESGMLLKGSHPIAIGMAVELEFCLPDEAEPVRGVAMVVRHTGNGEDPGIGLRFVDLNRQEMLRLRRFVDRTLSETPPVATAGETDTRAAGA